MKTKIVVLFLGLVALIMMAAYSFSGGNFTAATESQKVNGGDQGLTRSDGTSQSLIQQPKASPTVHENPPSGLPLQALPGGSLPPLPEELSNRISSEIKQRVVADFSRAPFFNTLADPDRQRLIDILTLGERSKMDAIAGGQIGQPPSAERMAAISQSVDQSVRELIGDANFGEYIEHQKNAPHRTVVELLNGNIAEPLSEPTAQSLIAILREEAESMKSLQGSGGDPRSMQASLAKMAERVEKQASTILTTDQLSALKGTLSQLFRLQNPKR